jgi:hypothetical protein
MPVYQAGANGECNKLFVDQNKQLLPHDLSDMVKCKL